MSINVRHFEMIKDPTRKDGSEGIQNGPGIGSQAYELRGTLWN